MTPDAAQSALRAAEPEIRRGVNKGVLKLNTASRRISRLSKKVNQMTKLGAGLNNFVYINRRVRHLTEIT